MRSIGQGLEGVLRREQERGHQRQMQAQGEQNVCAELRQTLHRVTQEVQQSQQQAMKYSQRMQEMLLTEVSMANVVRDLQGAAMRGSPSTQGLDAAAFSQEAMRIRNASQRQVSEIQMAEKAACDRLSAQLSQSQIMERQSRVDESRMAANLQEEANKYQRAEQRLLATKIEFESEDQGRY